MERSGSLLGLLKSAGSAGSAGERRRGRRQGREPSAEGRQREGRRRRLIFLFVERWIFPFFCFFPLLPRDKFCYSSSIFLPSSLINSKTLPGPAQTPTPRQPASPPAPPRRPAAGPGLLPRSAPRGGAPRARQRSRPRRSPSGTFPRRPSRLRRRRHFRGKEDAAPVAGSEEEHGHGHQDVGEGREQRPPVVPEGARLEELEFFRGFFSGFRGEF